MNEHQKATTFLRHVIFHDEGDEQRKLKKSIAQVEPRERFVQRFASVIALFFVLAIVGVGAMVAFAGLLMGYRKTPKRLRDAHQLASGRQESHLDEPDITTLPGSNRGSDGCESTQGVAEGSGYDDSPSWFSNRLCG
jgi:hypothetical protein